MICNVQKAIFIGDNDHFTHNVQDFQIIGAGDQGRVFCYGDKAIKLLKIGELEQENKEMMTFQKALFFKNNFHLKRITQPIDIVFDQNGNYTGYVMQCIPYYDKNKKSKYSIPSCYDFKCDSLRESFELLLEDFVDLSKKHVMVRDINGGSFIISFDFLHLCDMDRYNITTKNERQALTFNINALNFVIAKFLYAQMKHGMNLNAEEKKKILQWVKMSATNPNFLQLLFREIEPIEDELISDYIEYKAKRILQK